jgi:hypothetical protein
MNKIKNRVFSVRQDLLESKRYGVLEPLVQQILSYYNIHKQIEIVCEDGWVNVVIKELSDG